MKALDFCLVVIAFLGSPIVNAVPVNIVTDPTWEQSLDGVSWLAAEVQIDGTFADWIWPSSSVGMEAVYFRRVFELQGVPTYSIFHYGFIGDGVVVINGTEAFSRTGGSSFSGGVDVSSLIGSGLNEVFVEIRPTSSGSVYPGSFTGYLELEGAHLVPEPSTLWCVLLPVIGLLSRSRVAG